MKTSNAKQKSAKGIERILVALEADIAAAVAEIAAHRRAERQARRRRRAAAPTSAHAA